MRCQILFAAKGKEKYFRILSAENFTQGVKCSEKLLFTTETAGFF